MILLLQKGTRELLLPDDLPPPDRESELWAGSDADVALCPLTVTINKYIDESSEIALLFSC
jgi:hypothetical protein